MAEPLRQSRFDDLDDTDIRSVPLIEGIATALIDRPFVGLRPFNEDDGHLFFGRREQTNELLQRLHRTRLVAAVGGSGCGKSSLVRAGLIPALNAGFLVAERIEWDVLMMKPGERPLRSLAAILLQEDSSSRSPLVEAQVEQLRNYGADAVLEKLGSALETNKNVLLVVDQFEEVFRFGLGGDENVRDDAATFVSLLLTLTQRMSVPVYVVLTMRLDFIGDCSVYPGFAEAMNRSIYLVPRLSRQQRREAILGPTRMAGASIDPRLLDVLLNESDLESDQLPVLQHALMRTWEEWSWEVSRLAAGVEKPPIGITHYERAGTIGNALNKHAEEALEGLEPAAAERVFRALTDTDSSNRQIRHPAKLSELVEITQAPREKILDILDRFRSDGRCFLTLSCDPEDGDPVIDISHESLIRNWQRLGQWVKKEADSAANYRQLEEATALFIKGRAGLWTDPQLQLALEWRDSNLINPAWARRVRPSEFFQITQWERPDFDQACRFLDRSRVSRDEAKAEQLRVQEERIKQAQNLAAMRKTKRWAAVAFGCAIAAILLALYTWRLGRTLLYSKLTQQAKVIALTSPQSSVLLAVEALNIQPERRRVWEKEPENALQYALTTTGGRGLGLHRSDISSLASSPDSRWLVSGSLDGAALGWDLAAPLPALHPIELAKGSPGVLDHPVSVAVAGNRVMAVGSYDGTVRVSGRDKPVLSLKGSAISALSVAPNGHFLVAGTDQGALWLCDLSQKSGPVPVALPPWHKSRILHSEISADGSRLVTSDGTNRMAVWALGADQAPRWLHGKEQISAFALSAGQLAAGSLNGTVTLWDLNTLMKLPPPAYSLLPATPVTAVAFNSRSRYVAAVNASGNLTLWMGQGENHEVSPLLAWSPEMSHDRMTTVKISPDGRWLAAASRGNQVFLWPLPASGAPERRFALRGHKGPVKCFTFTADGRWLITGGTDGTLRRWDLALPDPSNKAVEQRPQDHDLRFITLRDDHWLVTSGEDAQGKPLTRLWDLTASPRQRLPVELPGVSAFDVNPGRQGSWLIAGDATDGSVNVWQLGSQGIAERPWLRLPPPDARPTRVLQVAMTPDRRFLLVLADKLPPRLWNLEKRSAAALDGVQFVAMSPDSRWLVLREQNSALVAWDLSSAPPRPTPILGASSGFRVLTFDGQGRIFCGGEDGRVSIYKLGSKGFALQKSFSAHNEAIDSLTVSSDDRQLVTGSEDGTAGIWDLKSKEIGTTEPVLLPEHEGPVVLSLFVADDRELLTVTGRGAVRRWRLTEPALKGEAEAVVGRNMLEREWQTYLPNEPFRKTFKDLPLLLGRD